MAPAKIYDELRYDDSDKKLFGRYHWFECHDTLTPKKCSTEKWEALGAVELTESHDDLEDLQELHCNLNKKQLVIAVQQLRLLKGRIMPTDIQPNNVEEWLIEEGFFTPDDWAKERQDEPGIRSAGRINALVQTTIELFDWLMEHDCDFSGVPFTDLSEFKSMKVVLNRPKTRNNDEKVQPAEQDAKDNREVAVSPPGRGDHDQGTGQPTDQATENDRGAILSHSDLRDSDQGIRATEIDTKVDREVVLNPPNGVDSDQSVLPDSQDTKKDQVKRELEATRLQLGKSVPPETMYRIAQKVRLTGIEDIPEFSQFKKGTTAYQLAYKYASELGYSRKKKMQDEKD